MTRSAGTRRAGALGFFWGFAEGLFFIIVPDVYITAATLFSIRSGSMAWLGSIAGSVVAVLAIYGLMVPLGLDYLRFLEHLPGINLVLIEQVRNTISRAGLPYTPLLIFGGIPLKVYGGVALSQGLSLGPLLIWTIFARFVRIAPTFVLAAVVRRLFRRSVDAHAGRWLVALALLWFVFYVFYFLAMNRI